MAGVRVIVTLNFPHQDAADQAVGGMAQAFKPVLQEPGALQYELFRSVDNPGRVILMEHWASRELYDQHWHKQMREQGAPDQEQARALNPTFEFYAQENYELVDGIWEPLDPADRLSTIRWA